MARSAHYEGGLNTIAQVFPVGTTGTHVVGVMPKHGKITRVRFHGDAAETSLSGRVRIHGLAGSGTTDITLLTDIGAVFNSATTARAGVEAVLENQAARDARDTQVITVLFTGTSEGDIAVVVNFEPR